MSADPIIYCLEQLTDYRQFERLCCDIMAGSGYPSIEPLGGSSDGGRDALHTNRHDADDITIFAFTVRADWKRKILKEDCVRIQDEGHQLRRVCFACTSSLTASEKDTLKKDVKEQFSWECDIYDLERLRIRLAGEVRHLVAQHPSIFPPPWFPARGGLSLAESADTLVIDHVAADHAFATWLARRLQLGGYRVWCFGTAPLGGEDADQTVRLLLEKRALNYLPVLSPDALADADIVARCGGASGIEGFLIPCWAGTIDPNQLNNKLRAATPVRFDESWSVGLRELLNVLEARGIKPSLEKEKGREIALRSYVPEQVTSTVPEQVYSNVFAATVPAALITCELERELNEDEILELRQKWAFVQVHKLRLLSFHEPPDSLPISRQGRLPEYAWEYSPNREEKKATDIIKELIRRCLELACYDAGLQRCPDRDVLYFPHLEKPQRNVSYQHVDGRNAWVGVTGEKSLGQGERATPFRYQLAPMFKIGQDESGRWWVTTRVYVRVTTVDGEPIVKKGIGRRRKVVTRSWWNKEWFSRTLAVMQAIGNADSTIEIGSGHRTVRISTVPLNWECPVSINTDALDRVGDFQEEMAAMRFMEEPDDEDEEFLPENDQALEPDVEVLTDE